MIDPFTQAKFDSMISGEPMAVPGPTVAPPPEPRILIAEDDPVSLRVLQAFLSKWKYQVVMATVQAGAEFHGVERLGEVIVRAKSKAAQEIAFQAARGEQQNVHVRTIHELAYMAADFRPLHAGHHPVQNGQRRSVVGLENTQRFQAIASDRASTLMLAERIRSATAAEPVDFDQRRISTTVSMGVAVCGGEKSGDVNTLLRCADEALYRAKRLGRNRVEFASPQELSLPATLPDPAALETK